MLQSASEVERTANLLSSKLEVFQTVFIAAPDGELMARLEKGVPGTSLPNPREREYFMSKVPRLCSTAT